MLTDIGLASIVIGKRWRTDMGHDDGSLRDLAKSIEENGLINPVLVNIKHELIAGARRIEAYKLLGRKRITCRVVNNYKDTLSAIRAEFAENESRKPFTVEERVKIAKEIERLLGPAAAARKSNGVSTNLTANLPQGRTPTVKDDAAKQVDMSRRTLEAAEEVVEAAKEDPSLRPIVDEMNKTGKVNPALRKVREKTKPKTTVKENDGEPPPWAEHAEAMSGVLSNIRQARALLKQAYEKAVELAPNNPWLDDNAVKLDCDQAREHAQHMHVSVVFAVPHDVCASCGGKKCKDCKQKGWMPKDVHKRAVEANKQ